VAVKPTGQGDYKKMERLYCVRHSTNRLSLILFDNNIIRFVRIFAPYALNAGELTDAVNEWGVFATNEGMIQRAYDYWILGQGAGEKRPRWSIVRDVLGWVE